MLVLTMKFLSAKTAQRFHKLNNNSLNGAHMRSIQAGDEVCFLKKLHKIISSQKFRPPFQRGQGSRGQRPSSPLASGEILLPLGAPQGVNFKTVLWTVLKEGTPCDRGRPLLDVKRNNKFMHFD